MKTHWERIKVLGRRTIEESILLGEKLIELKKDTEHGNWLVTLDEIGIHVKMAERLMIAFYKKDNAINNISYSELVGATVSNTTSCRIVDPFSHWSEEELQLKKKWNDKDQELKNLVTDAGFGKPTITKTMRFIYVKSVKY